MTMVKYGSDWNIFQIVSKMFIHFVQLCCVTEVFIVAKFVVVIFSFIYKH